jgi:hypothetical protein
MLDKVAIPGFIPNETQRRHDEQRGGTSLEDMDKAIAEGYANAGKAGLDEQE